MEGLKVKCQTCGTVLYETTAKYNCHKPLTGDMLRLLPLYKDWPCYDGALATESTPRFLMFCSQCAGYISLDGKLIFVDFPDKQVTEISKERSKMSWEDPFVELDKILADTNEFGTGDLVDNLILPNAEDSVLSDDLQKADPDLMTPKELMKKLDEQSRGK